MNIIFVKDIQEILMKICVMFQNINRICTIEEIPYTKNNVFPSSFTGASLFVIPEISGSISSVVCPDSLIIKTILIKSVIKQNITDCFNPLIVIVALKSISEKFYDYNKDNKETPVYDLLVDTGLWLNTLTIRSAISCCSLP
jgi:hypothetical protein